MLRNIASQKWRVYAWDTTTGLAKTGDAANITGRIRIDDGASAATNDTNPTVASDTNEKGYYDFDLTQAESNGDKLSLVPASATANIQCVACPPVVYTRPQYLSVLGVESDGDLTKVNTLNGHTPQTGDNFAIVNSGTHGNAALKTLIDTIDNIIDTEFPALVTTIGVAGAGLTAITSKTDNLPSDPADQSLIIAATTAITNAIAALENLSAAGAQTAVTSALTAALTEGYRATNSTGSVRDLMYEIMAHLGEHEIVGVTKTTKKLDGSTTAKTYTLNNATTPTGITEAT